MAYELTDRDIYISKTKQTNLNLFWAGFILYTVSYQLTTTLIYFNIVQLQALQFLGLLMFSYATVNIIKFRIKNSYLKTIYYLYLLWSVSIMARGFLFDISSIKESLANPGSGLLIYFVPLFLLFPVNFAYYRKLFQVIFILSLFYLLYSLIFIKHVFDPDRQSTLAQGIVENFTMMSFASGFTLLTYVYHSKFRRLVAFGTMMAMLLFAIYRARRGLILMSVTTLLSVVIVYLIVTKRTAMVIYVVIIMGLLGYFYYSSLYNQKNFGIFNFLVERSDEDTRTGVEDAMKDDMSSTEWIIGKGINGEYYCPNIDALDEKGYRNVVETGYLQIILKGGIGSLVLLLLIFIPALYRGFTKSKNIFGKACAIWLLLWTAFLYPSIGNTFTMSYIIAWLSVAVCYSPHILNMTDTEIADAMIEPKKSSGRKPINRVAQPEV